MRATASKAGLLLACGYFARPEAEWYDVSGPAADRGTRLHRAIAAYVSTGEVSPLDEDIADLFASARAWVDHFGREKLAAEVAFAWHPETDTAERVTLADERDYSDMQAEGKLCGTADLVAVSRATRAGYIADWKTGDASNAGPQLRTLALMLARAEGLDMVTVEALQVDETGVTHLCTETLDAFALAAVSGDLAEAVAGVPTAEPVPGPHCGEGYCPARATCPAVVERVETDIIPAASLVRHRWGVRISSPDHAAWLYEQAKVVEAAAKLVKDAVRAYVPEAGLVLEDGSVLREGTRNMPRFQKDVAVALLRELGATEEQIAGLTRSMVESSGLRVQTAKPRAKRGKAA